MQGIASTDVLDRMIIYISSSTSVFATAFQERLEKELVCMIKAFYQIRTLNIGMKAAQLASEVMHPLHLNP